VPGSTPSTSLYRKGVFSLSVPASTQYLLSFFPDQLPSSTYQSQFYTPNVTVMSPAQGTASNGINVVPIAGQIINFNDISQFRAVSAFVSVTNITPVLTRSCMAYSACLPVRVTNSTSATSLGNLTVPTASNLASATMLWPSQVSNQSSFTAAGAKIVSLCTNEVLTTRWFSTPANVSNWSETIDSLASNSFSTSGSTGYDVRAIFFIFDNNSASAQTLQFEYGFTIEMVSSNSSTTYGADINGVDGGITPEAVLSSLVDNRHLDPVVTREFFSQDDISMDFRC